MSRNSPAVEIKLSGRVQGVGFRPHVVRLARSLELAGEVLNASSGVLIRLEADDEAISLFRESLLTTSPGRIESFDCRTVPYTGYAGFHIADSQPDIAVADVLMADRGICSECEREFRDPRDRRYGYLFNSCAACGPRYAIVDRLPWDRANTSWADFPMCRHCREEFEDPGDRRFHAVGISCPDCGPKLFNREGLEGEAALKAAVQCLESGGIVAMKMLGGYQLLSDAENPAACARLKARKRRQKPMAVLARGIGWLQSRTDLSEIESEILQGPARPILLIRDRGELSRHLAPGLDMLGVMLPHSALQLALAARLGRPLVATSGNYSGEPLVFEEGEAESVLGNIADLVLHHDLRLTQGLDDSVIRVMAAKAVPVRLGRGLAPVSLRCPDADGLLGCGGHQKATVAVAAQERILVSQHVGDLDTVKTRDRYRQLKSQLPALLQAGELAEVTDLHPDYGSTMEADYRSDRVPHHVAHAMASSLGTGVSPPFIALTWDGTGLGPDGSLWGSEFLLFDEYWQWQRIGHLEPWRMSAADEMALRPGKVAEAMLTGTATGHLTTSMGRLFDAVAALLDLRQVSEFEGQAAMELEAHAWRASRGQRLSFDIDGGLIGWRGLLETIRSCDGRTVEIALGFHQSLVEATMQIASDAGISRMLLAGGVFQNRLLVELLAIAARARKIDLSVSGILPPNDASISAGQCLAIAREVRQSEVRRTGKLTCA